MLDLARVVGRNPESGVTCGGGELGNRTGRRDMKNRDANETGDRTLVSLRGTGWETPREGE